MSPLVSQGLELALYGMGVVFVFLTLLVLVTMAMSKLVLMMNPPDLQPAPAPASTPEGGLDARKLAVITAAIHQHRKQQR